MKPFSWLWQYLGVRTEDGGQWLESVDGGAAADESCGRREAAHVDCKDWRQGDVFDGGRVFTFDKSWNPTEIPCADGVVVVSQSCDASQVARPTLQIAPVVALDGSNRKIALLGRRPMYAHLPALGDDPRFADLDSIVTVEKSALVGLKRTAGVTNDKDVRRFALAVARKFGRFAYPDEIVEGLRPLTEVLVSKATKSTTPIGAVLLDVDSLRVQCADWFTKPWNLTLVVIMKPGVLPFDIDGITSNFEELRSRFSNAKTGKLATESSNIATFIRDCSDESECYWAWNCLVQSWVDQCLEQIEELGYANSIPSMDYELVSEDEYSLANFNRSEALDLDYLSAPTPRADNDPNL